MANPIEMFPSRISDRLVKAKEISGKGRMAGGYSHEQDTAYIPASDTAFARTVRMHEAAHAIWSRNTKLKANDFIGQGIEDAKIHQLLQTTGSVRRDELYAALNDVRSVAKRVAKSKDRAVQGVQLLRAGAILRKSGEYTDLAGNGHTTSEIGTNALIETAAQYHPQGIKMVDSILSEIKAGNMAAARSLTSKFFTGKTAEEKEQEDGDDQPEQEQEQPKGDQQDGQESDKSDKSKSGKGQQGSGKGDSGDSGDSSNGSNSKAPKQDKPETKPETKPEANDAQGSDSSDSSDDLVVDFGDDFGDDEGEEEYGEDEDGDGEGNAGGEAGDDEDFLPEDEEDEGEGSNSSQSDSGTGSRSGKPAGTGASANDYQPTSRKESEPKSTLSADKEEKIPADMAGGKLEDYIPVSTKKAETIHRLVESRKDSEDGTVTAISGDDGTPLYSGRAYEGGEIPYPVMYVHTLSPNAARKVKGRGRNEWRSAAQGMKIRSNRLALNAASPCGGGRLFETKNLGGTVLIDASGSMSLDDSALYEIAEKIPAGKVAYYSGKMDYWYGPHFSDEVSREENLEAYWTGNLVVYAHAGRIRKDQGMKLPKRDNCNLVDYQALLWLLKQPGPRYIMTDGPNGFTGPLKLRAAALLKESIEKKKIIQFRSMEKLMEMIRKK